MRVAAAILVGVFSTAAVAQSFDPGPLQAADGALLINRGEQEVDPYFAMKALVVASDAGLDITQSATRFIAWLLPKQKKDGRFDRYCKRNGVWQVCAAADADDSMLALWLQLVYRMAPNSGLSPELLASTQRAQQHLRSLRNARLGVYHVSHRNHVALFMDNVEVYEALNDVARAQRRFGDTAAAAQTEADAESLARGIRRVFWDERTQSFRPSIQKQQPRFYPDVLAQTYAWMAALPLPQGDAESAWTRWKQRYTEAWLSNRYDPHPWGLVALTAIKMGDNSIAGCWLDHASAARFGSEWNVLEEAAYQAVEARIGSAAQANSACKQPERGE